MKMTPASIYEALFSFEKHRDKKNNGYPIHKKLNFAEANLNDIYDLILDQFDFKAGARILDAGCGVGFGSMKIAQHNDLDVTGISISQAEIHKARENAQLNELSDRLHFEHCSFDDMSEGNFDYIIAVESLKHSLDLGASLKSLENCLNPNGTIIIVEDFYQQQKVTNAGQTLMKDWSLVDLFRVSDFSKHLKKEKLIDLTDKMPKKSIWSLRLKSLMFGLLSINPVSQNRKVYRIFRGGILLDILFAQKLMKYELFVHKKGSGHA